MTLQRVAVVGAGIVGLAVAREISNRRPGVEVTVFDKEDRVGAHQTGHNSGVLHAGVYYAPGSLKARLCRRGGGLMRDYCAEHGIPVHDVGKVVVATSPDELAKLHDLHARAAANGVPGLAWLDQAALAEVEPAVRGLAAVHSPRTAVLDFAAVAGALAADVTAGGGQVRLGREVAGLRRRGDTVEVLTDEGLSAYDAVVVCAGAGGDPLARSVGAVDGLRVVPFRGEYYRVAGAARDLVRGCVYPVPDPRLPFLGVHLTRTHDGEVLVGPNAVLALSREGYRWRDVDLRDLRDVARWPGSWRLARRYWRTAGSELAGSLSRRVFIARARRYVPALTDRDVVRAGSGVRAQAVDRAGDLLDDFAIEARDRVLLVRNAPSPAATSSLAIAEHVVDQVPGLSTR